MPKRQVTSSKRNRSAPQGLADRWHSLAIHLLRRVRVRDHTSGLTPARLSALSVIVYGGPLNLAKLATAEGVRPPTMSRLVAALVADGLVSRSVNEDNRRSYFLSPTRRGIQRLNKARRERLRLLSALLGQASSPETALLGEAAQVLERLLGGKS